ncbi:MAG: DUF922 domain-containing protein [Lysobacteraceae bacterium]
MQCVFLVLLFGLSPVCLALGPVRLVAEIEHHDFPVFSVRPNAVIHDLRPHPEMDDPSRHYEGLTKASLELQQSLEQTPGNCVVESISIRLSQEVRIPRWQPPEAPSAEMRDRWQRARDALLAHEQTHVGYSMEAADTLKATLETMPGDQDCRTLERSIERAYRRSLVHLSLRHSMFDARTRHGDLEDL